MSTETPSLTTQCNKCQSVFRVQPQHLAAAKGWMQCGVCGNVFHTAMAEDVETQAASAVEAQAAEPGSPGQEAAAAPQPEPIAAQVNKRDEDIGETGRPLAEQVAEADESGPATLTGLSQRMAEQEADASFGPKLESIILVDPDIPAGDLGPMPTFDKEDEDARPATIFPSTSSVTSTAGSAANVATGWTPRQPFDNEKPARKSKTWLWSLLAVALLLFLAAQLAYFLRDDLAVRYPELRPQLTKMCEALNCKLTLPRDSKQVLILGSDLQTESSGTLALAVTLANRGNHAMAWPMLELTLTDVKDQAIGRRVFAPSEYLPSPEQEVAGIQPVSEVPLTIKLQTKGIKAVGYRLQMFY